MTNSPNPGQQPEPRRHRRRRILFRIGLGLGAVLLVGGGVGAWWVRRFIYQELAPLVEKNLSDTLSRPVELGDVQGFSLSGLEFGRSSLPPTDRDRDRATIERVKVAYNIWEVLYSRRLGLNVTLVQPDAFLDQSPEGEWISTQITTSDTESYIKTELDRIVVEDGTLTLAPSTVVMLGAGKPMPPNSSAPPVRFRHVSGDSLFLENNRLIKFDAQGEPAGGGDFRLRGEVRLPENEPTVLRLLVQGNALAAQEISRLVAIPVSFETGRVFSNIEVLVRGNELEELLGTARVADVTARVQNVPQLIQRVSGRLRFRGKLIQLEEGQATYGRIPATVNGTYHLDEGFNFVAQARSLDWRAIQATTGVDLPIPVSGAVNADIKLTGRPQQPLISGLITNSGAVRVDRVDFSRVATRFTLANQTLRLEEVVANPAAGGTIQGKGQIVLGDRGGLVLDVQARNLPGDAIARSYGLNNAQIRLGRLSADAEIFGALNAVQTQVRWRAPEATYPAQGLIAIGGDRIQFRDTVAQVAGGTVRANGEVAGGVWRASVQGSQVQLAQFSPQLQGVFSGNVQLAGSVNNFSTRTLRAQGELNFSEGVSYLNGPLTANVRWLGDRLQIDRAAAPGFNARGYVLAQLEGSGAPRIPGFNLDLQLQGYDLAKIPVALPNQVRVAGLVDFSGRVSGTPSVPQVAGALRLNNFAVNELQFEPVLAGGVQFVAGRGLNLDVQGVQDQIAVQLDPRYRPSSFLVRQGETLAQGTTRGDRLVAQLENFPLEVLNLSPAANVGLGEISGLLSGNVDVNLATLAAVGEVAIAEPGIGYIKGSSFTGRFRYGDGVASLSDAELRLNESRYLISGQFDQNANGQFKGEVIADQGNIQDILSALKWFDLSDLNRGLTPPTFAAAAEVQPIGVGDPNQSLINQLRRYSEILALLELQEQQRQSAIALPSLEELKGGFTGTVTFAGSPQAGVSLDFSLRGTDWNWGEYNVDQVIADGSFADGELTLLPLRLQSETSFLNFSGRVGGAEQSGQLLAENIPIEAIRDFFKLPIDIAGNLNASALIEGSLQNPSVRGEVSLVDGQLNQTAVQAAGVDFSYDNARLSVIGSLAVDAEHPLRVVGYVPYKFPFMTVEPASNEISLSVEVQNEGLSILNLFTDQVAWEGGEGKVDVDVSGTIEKPFVTGTAQFNGATFSAPTLPEPLTNVTGSVAFNGSLIQVESLTGQFERGEVTAQGILPVFDPSALPPTMGEAEPVNPLTVTLDQLALNFKGLYRGGVDGQVVVTGTALSPRIGGSIVLSDGQIELPGGGAQPTTAPAPTSEDSITSPPQFDNLQITLGRRMRVTLQPILNFLATGDLAINGTLGDLRPEGTIRVRSGQVNLFTTQFNLARGYPNTAEFTRARGLDPYLDVRLIATVPEVTRVPVQSNTGFGPSAEINETLATNIGSLNNVRIQATVNGPASQLFENLELTSSPSRSENEIISLLGGGFIDTLGQGDSTLAIANLAGSTLLTQLQNIIGNALGLTDFRLFPTYIPSDNESSSTLGLAAEVGVDITGNFSASVLQILTAESATQFNLRYRLNDQLLMRGYVDTDGGTGAILEFETRF